MSLTDKLVNWFGSDKLLHLLVAAWLTSWFTDFGFAIALAGGFFVFLLAYVKEKFLDDHFDQEDLAASFMGIIIEIVSYGFRAAIIEGLFDVTMPM